MFPSRLLGPVFWSGFRVLLSCPMNSRLSCNLCGTNRESQQNIYKDYCQQHLYCGLENTRISWFMTEFCIGVTVLISLQMLTCSGCRTRCLRSWQWRLYSASAEVVIWYDDSAGPKIISIRALFMFMVVCFFFYLINSQLIFFLDPIITFTWP